MGTITLETLDSDQLPYCSAEEKARVLFEFLTSRKQHLIFTKQVGSLEGWDRGEEYTPMRVFISYSIHDKRLVDEFEKHVVLLQRQEFIKVWHQQMLQPGVKAQEIIDENLQKADLILLMISPDFIASDYCFNHEMYRAFERDKSGDAITVPIILRPIEGWNTTLFGNHQALPRRSKAITLYQKRDLGWVEIASEIRKISSAFLKYRRNILQQTVESKRMTQPWA